ncbi:helix-turn-helix transcriptional regulator [Muricauda sp. SCSIO 64092]|uniref:helix-turn-helix domain-containing protein n=1 Tax=Allomuricauda sp. SCSIO 64092 TaxID=2908842 RepID=UPI001FF24A5C|nr:helix-turn-helix transcriptional regulator [Muricauda sp. SCSIO 64092]UOY07754.1 helix-turn-helix transcriptional regulator [Muricauda sp. SCSIO 64092]
MSVISKRIQEYLDAKGLSARQMSLSIGKGQGYLADALKKGSSISVDTISEICDAYRDFNPAYLLTGKGNLLLSTNKVSEEGAVYQPQSKLDKAIDDRIDQRIDLKLEEKLESDFTNDIITEFIRNQIEEELAKVQKENSK